MTYDEGTLAVFPMVASEQKSRLLHSAPAPGTDPRQYLNHNVVMADSNRETAQYYALDDATAKS